MRQALKDLNDAGGVAGRPLELIVLDTQAEPPLGINAMNRLINVDKTPVILTAWSSVIKAQAPIVPVAVSGGRAAMQKGSWFVRPVMVDVRIGAPVETAGMSVDDRDELIEIA